MSELSIHPINYSENSRIKNYPLQKSSSAHDLFLLPHNNNNIINHKGLSNVSITMSRFNSGHPTSNNSNNKEKNKPLLPHGASSSSRPKRYSPGIPPVGNKRRITKPDFMNPSNFLMTDSIKNEQLLLSSSQQANAVTSCLRNSISNQFLSNVLNENSTPPPSTPSMDPTYKKVINVTPQPSYIISDPSMMMKSPLVGAGTPHNNNNNYDQVSSSRINNSSGVSPNRIPTQANSPLENTIFSNRSPTISPEHTMNQQQLNNANNNTTTYETFHQPQQQPINTIIPNNDKLASMTGYAESPNIPQNNQQYDTTNSNGDDNNYDSNKKNSEDNFNNEDNSNTNTNNDNNNNNNINNNNNNNNDGNNPDNNRSSDKTNGKKTGQALIQKLQDIYKLIVKQEIELQDRCAQLTTSQTTELKNLWTIYKINIDLINNYTTFITTALLPSQSQQDILIGEEIIEIYRIERRLWVYGTITFLDVLKNFSNFMDPDVCSQFITHVFISLSTMLIDIPPKHSIPWLQRLGDLSRMAIALYPSGFIDWKLSAEYWYLEAMKFTYSHGKLYYHMSTVQQNTLEAFVNLGKSVFCQDTFTPSQQYMQLVIDNIYQRTFVDRTNNGNIRNSDLIDYLKHSEVMLLPTFLENAELQRVVLNYFQDRFGIDYNENNIFETQQMFTQIPSSLRFYFRHAPAFAESHILQIIGFGDPKNPFAILFDLPKYLKERKDKKDKNRSRTADSNSNNTNDSNNNNNNGNVNNTATTSIATSSTTTTTVNSPISILQPSGDFGSDMSIDQTSIQLSTTEFFENIDSLKSPIKKANIYIWLKSLDFVNLTSLKCSMIVLKKFLHGPFLIALPHFLPWAYFIVATATKARRTFQDDDSSLKFWNVLIKRLFPWNTISSFLNILIAYALDNFHNCECIDKICNEYSKFETLDEFLSYFNNNEELPEVWKCWGTLWYDTLCDKGALKAENFQQLGIKDHMFLDLPIDGIDFDTQDEIGEKFWKRALRLIFMFKKIAEELDIGLAISNNASVYCNDPQVEPLHVLRTFCFKAIPYTEETSTRFNEMIPLCEEIDEINSNFNTIPSLSLIPGESIFDYLGYKKFFPDGESFDKNGDVISSSLYTKYLVDNKTSMNNNGSASVAIDSSKSSSGINFTNAAATTTTTTATTSAEITPSQTIPVQPSINNLFGDEEEWFTKYMGQENTFDNFNGPMDVINKEFTYFVFDATSWLRHFAHIYKLATNNLLRFAVCLTTFQELRFLRKSKDENVVEAAARAIITMRQLYREDKLLPLRFTGNMAADIEEHLEVEEQITWRSHVDEFVIEAVMKAQQKFKEHNTIGLSSDFIYVVLVTDDVTMAKKAKDQQVMTFSTHFVFSLCTKMGIKNNICTN
ncbi:similar to Saccharomyces cerevisiae YIL151C ESL1 Putative protein of unknown function, predicted to contain a PINc domain [Maudiozyma saulgeensis]|uniref:PIN domain-containing protein n=1 Tax=Maudiozyma saulgeensis TaxID=1789683 RepID=A0A1X7R9J3_9SACH|nr:similar to Saccharomyces cerevisiae YIL151C ESL1 Putative protein of unknown function, predicted to contain a PINc domain [Kazachstania saulgeensis]